MRYEGIYLKIFDQLIFVLLVNSSSECKAKTKSQQTLLIGLPAIFAPTRMSIWPKQPLPRVNMLTDGHCLSCIWSSLVSVQSEQQRSTVQMWRICSRNESESVPLIFSRIYLARASDCNILNMWRAQITWLCFASDIETVLHALGDLQLSPQGQHLASKTRGLIRDLALS